MTIRLLARISPHPDKKATDSVPKQLIAGREWAAIAHPGQAVVEYPELKVSGKSLKKRTIFKQMIEDSQRGDIVWCRSIDRFARHILTQVHYADVLERKGVRIFTQEFGWWSDPEDPSVELRSLTLSVFAHYQGKLNSLRSRRAAQKKVMQGVYTGGRVQYGFDLAIEGTRMKDDVEIPNRIQKPNERQQSCIRFIIREHRDGVSVADILTELKRNWRHAQPENSVFTKKLISRIISRENKRFSTPLPANSPQNAT